MGDSDLAPTIEEDLYSNDRDNKKGAPGKDTQAGGKIEAPTQSNNGQSHGSKTAASNMTDSAPAGTPPTKPEIKSRFQEALDRKRKEKGLPPIPRPPNRDNQLEKDDVLLYNGIARYVIKRGKDIAIKYGNHMVIGEAEALDFAKQAGVPVPNVISFGQQGRSHHYIEMDYVEGDTLENLWRGMNPEVRLSVAHQLRDILKVMRKLPPPPNFIGAFNRNELRDVRHYDIFVRPSCPDEAAFNTFLTEDETIPAAIRRGFRHFVGTSHRVVFSHCDLAPRNIMIRDGRIVALLDWEAAGWYPEYWEYVKFMHMGGLDDAWQSFVDEVFTERYDDELVAYTGLLWFQRQIDGKRQNRRDAEQVEAGRARSQGVRGETRSRWD